MSDPALRSLERAFASGEESARVPLAAAYLRQGDSSAALGLLTSPAVLPTEAARVHEEAWRRELSTLAPSGREHPLGQEVTDVALVGFFGPAPRTDRFAAIGTHGILRVFDLDRGELVHGTAILGDPLATSSHALFVRTAAGAMRIEPPRVNDTEWRVTPVTLHAAEAPPRISPDGALALAGEQGALVLVTLPDFHIIRMIGQSAACGVDWGRSRLVSWNLGKVSVTGLDARASTSFYDVALAVRRLAPRVAGGLPVGPGDAPRLFQLLADGRLLLGPPLVLVDLSTGECTVPPGGADADLQGPARLSRDGSAVLAFRDDAPVRVPLVGEAPARPLRAPVKGWPRRAWHPFADVAMLESLEKNQPELRGADGEVLHALPRDVRPLGWTPDGRGLLVLRRRGALGALELWRVREQA